MTPEVYPERIRQCHNKLMNMQALRLNEIESEMVKTLRQLEKIIKICSKEGSADVLKLALEERNRISEYLYKVNKG